MTMYNFYYPKACLQGVWYVGLYRYACKTTHRLPIRKNASDHICKWCTAYTASRKFNYHATMHVCMHTCLACIHGIYAYMFTWYVGYRYLFVYNVIGILYNASYTNSRSAH